MNKPRTIDVARGKWRGILMALGIESRFLTGKHGPCPACGGTDRFRFDNQGGDGSFICSQCGSGNGFKLLELVKGWDFRIAAAEVDKVIGNVRSEPVRSKPSPDDSRRLSVALWQGGTPIRVDDPAGLYLASRGLELPQNRDALRFASQCPVPHEPGSRMAMLAKITGPDGKGALVHRTFLTPQGRKADMADPRATMPGSIPDGSAIRLASVYGEHLGIGEGIETSLKAGQRFGVPTWAAVNATMLAKWTPPLGVKRVSIFGDHDAKFGGQAAAFALAHRLAAREGLEVEMHIPGFTIQPEMIGRDWADRDAA